MQVFLTVFFRGLASSDGRVKFSRFCPAVI
jgi:hypothetical protein